MPRSLEISTPRWLLPLLQPARYKGAHGGRGSGKSHAFAELMIEAHVLDGDRSSVCVREVQKILVDIAAEPLIKQGGLLNSLKNTVSRLGRMDILAGGKGEQK